MLKAVVGVLAGYIIMAVVVLTSFSIAYVLMGADRAFEPGSYDPSALWIGTSFVLGFIAAAVGGAVGTLIWCFRQKVVVAALVMVIGLSMAVAGMMAPAGPVTARTGDVDNLEAMKAAKTPDWVALANPFVGAAGVLAGLALVGRRGCARTG